MEIVAIAEGDSMYLVATVRMVVAIAGCIGGEVVGHTVVVVVDYTVAVETIGDTALVDRSSFFHPLSYTDTKETFINRLIDYRGYTEGWREEKGYVSVKMRLRLYPCVSMLYECWFVHAFVYELGALPSQ